jgi:tetratricopeptide (TPR) repeat protein
MIPAIQSSAMACHQEVTRLLQVGDLKAAEALCNRLTADFPQFYPGWHNASFIALCRGQISTALKMIQRALTHSPSDPRYLLQHARCLAAQRRLAESIASASAAERAAASDAQLLDAIGSFYNSIGEHQKASEAYSRALCLDPSQAVFWFNRATVRRFLGQIAAAEEDYDRVMTTRLTATGPTCANRLGNAITSRRWRQYSHLVLRSGAVKFSYVTHSRSNTKISSNIRNPGVTSREALDYVGSI